MRSASRCTPTSSASARTRPTKTATGSPTSPARHWLPALHHAMRNFKDESFIGQYLSPKLIRDLRLFAILDDEHAGATCEVSAIHDDAGYRHVREALSRQYDLGCARAQHPGLERQPARRPLADAAPHPAQQPAAARRRPGSAQARRPPVGLRRQPRERRPVGRREHALVDRAGTAQPEQPRRRRDGLLPPRPRAPRGRGRPRRAARFALLRARRSCPGS